MEEMCIRDRFMSEDEASETENAYKEEGDICTLRKDVDKETREKLNESFGKPMLILMGLTAGGEESEKMLAEMHIPEGTDPVQAIAAMPEEARAQMTEAMGEKFAEMPDSIITQAAVSYVQMLSLIHILFVFLLIVIVLLIGALSFFPALALGPIAEFVG